MSRLSLNQAQDDRSSLGISQHAVFSSAQPLTLEAVQALLMTTQDAIIANTTAAIAAAQEDFRIYVKHELAALEARMLAAEKCLERIPLQLSNSRMPFNSPLQYPAGMQIVQGMPVHKRDICNLLESDCIVTARVLGLSELPGEPTVAQRRAQIGEFFGAM